MAEAAQTPSRFTHHPPNLHPKPRSGEISEEIQLSSICSKLALLALRFPDLRVLWARNSHCTVQLFQSLKVNNAPVDVQKALVRGFGSLVGVDGRCMHDRSSLSHLHLYGHVSKPTNRPSQHTSRQTAGGGSAAGEDSSAGRNLAAQDFLLKLPGVNAANARTIMRSVESLAALAAMSQEELRALLESEANARRLWEFLHHNPNKEEEEEEGGARGAAGKGRK